MSSGNDKNLPRVAVIGCGYWGKNLVRNFAEIGVLRHVCDVNMEQAKSLAAQYGAEAVSLEDALRSDDIAGVAIAAPAELHAEIGQKALHAGKHVFVEKPLALTLGDAEKLIASADEKNLTLMIGHLLQYHPAFLKLKDMVHGGEIGKLQYVYSTRLNFGKIRTEEDILWSFAPHDISMILSLAGEEPEDIRAIGNRYLHHEICDTTITHLKFPGGVAGHVFVSWLHPHKEQRLVVTGEEGMIVFDDTRPWAEKLSLYRHRVDWVGGRPEPNKAEPEHIPLDEAEPLKLECRHFLDCITSGKAPRTDGAEGLRVLKVLDAASEQLGQDLEETEAAHG